MFWLNLSTERLAKLTPTWFYVSICHIESRKHIADERMIRMKKKRRMSNLQQETVKLILEALHSTNLTIESFVITAISLESPLSTSFLNGGVETLLDNLLQNGSISVTGLNRDWVTFQAMKIYKKEMTDLTSKENGFHFLTAKMAFIKYEV